MPKMGPGKGRRGGGRGLSSNFNALADPMASEAFSSNAFNTSSFDGDDQRPRSQPSMAPISAWSGR